MEITVSPRYINSQEYREEDIIKDIRTIFGLNEFPFEEIDNDLLLLAFIPRCINILISPMTIQRLRNKFGSCVHQTLEFYGDRVFYSVISSLLYELFGLENNQNFLSQLTSYLASNRFLTDLMMNKNACSLVRHSKYIIKGGPKIHNICADSFEALVGALFIYLKERDVNYVETIKKWVLKNTNLPFSLNEYLRTIQNTSAVYTIQDKKKLIKGLERNRSNELRLLESLKGELDPHLYQSLHEEIENEVTLLMDDFATLSIIVDPKDPLSTIYKSLKWNYTGPIHYPETDTYYILGFPKGREKIIGTGLSPEEADFDARHYLIQMGYIILMKSIPRYLSRLGMS